MAKSKGKVKAHAQWHADFRVIDTLPDTKIIRTDFMLTFVAVSLAVGLLFLFCFREYKSFTLGREIAGLKSDIKQNSADNQNYLRLDSRFNSLSKKVIELESFRYNPYPPPDFLIALSETDFRSKEIIISNVLFREVIQKEGRKIIKVSQASLSGSVTGSSEQATQIVSDYVEKLNSMELLSEFINIIQLKSLDRNEESGSFQFSIVIELNPEKS